MTNITLTDAVPAPHMTAHPPGDAPIDRRALRLSAALLAVGQIVFIVAGLFHPSHEDANDHQAVFAEYAASAKWIPVHLGQFVGLTIMMAGLIALLYALNVRSRAAGWLARFGAVSAAVTVGLYAILQAVDGVVLKHAVDAWAHAPVAQKAAAFSDAETVRWLEWGTRSYQQMVQGLALVLLAAVILPTARLPRTVGVLAAISGGGFIVQGYVIGAEGFSMESDHFGLIALVFGLVWVIAVVTTAVRSKPIQPASALS